MTKIAQILLDLIATKKTELDDWFDRQYLSTPSCFYSSVDVRDSGYKIAPVDTNLFPAGFNNLTNAGIDRAIAQAKTYFTHYYPACKKIILIPENHSRNSFYFANVAALKSILKQADQDVEIALIVKDASLLEEIKTNAATLSVQQALRSDNKIITTGFIPDLILLNTDLTSGIPEELASISQPVIPNPNLGWHQRTKSKHFTAYDQVIDDFCQHFGLDKFLLSTTHYCCGKIDFKEQKGVECVALAVDKAIYHLQKKYQEYGITDQPYVYIKAERGTYGMGIMTATSSEDVFAINKKIRNKMDVIKEGMINSEVIIQEGVRSINKIDTHAAEPLVYLLNGEVIDCFFRSNPSKDDLGNLNSKGAIITSNTASFGENSEQIPAYNLVAKLASLAAARE